MYVLILTLFFNATSPSGVNTFNQSVLTKAEDRYFTKEECEYLQETFMENIRPEFIKAQREKGLKQISTACIPVDTLMYKQKEENPAVLPFKERKGSSYKFNGAKEV